MSTESQGDQCACVSSGHRVPGGVYVLGKDIGSQVQGYRVPGGPTCLCQGWSKTGVGVIVSTLRVIGYWEGGGEGQCVCVSCGQRQGCGSYGASPVCQQR